MQLSLRFLGPFEAQLDDGTKIESRAKKIEALLAFLVAEADRSHRRERLVGLLFPEMPDEQARTNLRQTLTRLRRAIHDQKANPPFLIISRESTQFNLQSDHSLDITLFNDLIDGCELHRGLRDLNCEDCVERLAEAVRLYRGPFLEGFTLEDSVAFEEWVLLKQEHYKVEALNALQQLADHYEQRGAYVLAADHVRRQLQLEPWKEDSHRQLIRLLAYQGERVAALQQYKTLETMLQDELGVRPLPETRTLVDQIRAAEDTRPHQLPPRNAIFVGRSDELALIQDYLSDPAVRLLTLTGTGGSGKTAIAVEAGWRVGDRFIGPFIHGVYFVPLAGIDHDSQRSHASSSEFDPLITAIAEAIGYSFSGPRQPRQQLFRYLQDRSLLLIIDNVEHVIAVARTLLRDLLNHAPGIKILITSRERLGISDEWVMEIEGLPYPTVEPSVEQASGKLSNLATLTGQYQSIALFESTGKRLVPTFELNENGVAARPGGCPVSAVQRITQMVQGLPLGIQLAASWIRTLSCTEIADEIEKNLDFLSSTMHDMPSRHKSLRAVFDSSWQLLEQDEQAMLKRLSVFHGPFNRSAATEITGVSTITINSLVDHSLLHHQDTTWPDQSRGSYELLDVIRQFAAERLDQDPEEAEQIRHQHAAYFLQLITGQQVVLSSSEQRTAVAQISHHIKEIRSAWRWAVQHHDLPRLSQALDALGLFYYMRSWFAEGADLFALAANELEPMRGKQPVNLLWGQLRARQGWFIFLLGRQAAGRDMLLESIDVLRRSGEPSALAYSLSFSAAALSRLGNYEIAITLANESLAINEECQDAYGCAIINNILGQIAFQQGDYIAARQYSETSLALEREIGNHWSIGFSLSNLGRVAFALQSYQEANQHFRESLVIREELQDKRGQALCYRYLGDTALAQGKLEQAQRNYETSLALFRDIGSQDETSATLFHLGRSALLSGERTVAQYRFVESLRMARQAASIPRILEAITGLASLIADNHPLPAAQLAITVLNHPAANRASRQLANQLLDSARPRQNLEVRSRIDLDNFSKELLAIFTASDALQQEAARKISARLSLHNLVPPFILENLQHDILDGSFSCAALFVDISGFTRVTEALMEHGQYGAEVLAGVMRAVFTPLVDSIYEQGGFVTGFAGDAFTAVFPAIGAGKKPEPHALAAAWQMQQRMTLSSLQETRFGTFSFSVKIGLASGKAIWGILQSENGSKATYYFSGPAIDDCAQAEHLASAGEIICSPHFFQMVQDRVAVKRLKDYCRIDNVTGDLPASRTMTSTRPAGNLLTRFAPRYLVEQDIEGEFRPILNLFIGIKGAPTRQELTTLMRLVFRLQEQYGGFLNRIDFGDKGCHLLLFWGAPLSHEQDLAHVLDFLLTLFEASELTLRAGITYRIAHAGFIGSTLAEEYTCYGRGVNLAARQMTGAGWGEIWLDDETARRAQNDYLVESIGERTFKGFASVQQIFRLRGRREKRASRFENKPLVGRQKELDWLNKAIQPVFEGSFAGIITVTGEAGVGKSRLVDALLQPLIEQDRAAVFLCQANELIRQSLNPFQYFLLRYFNQATAGSDADNKAQFLKQLSSLEDAVLDAELKEELQRTYSFLGNLIGLQWADSLYEQLDPELRFENTLSGLKALFKAESLRQPVIIHLEDAHWWDKDTQTFLTYLTRNVDEYPFALLITSRDSLPENLFESTIPSQAAHLQRLGRDSLQEITENILGRPPSPSLVKLLLERTEGNPFFVEQVLLYLRDHDLLEVVESEQDQARPGNVYIPTDVRAVLTARLDRLPFGMKDLIQKASILGQEFDTSILATMVEDVPELDSHLAMGEAERVWFSTGSSRYVFRHALLRDAAYEMQLGARLRQLHHTAALAYEQQFPEPSRAIHYSEIAYHFDCAENAGQAQQYYNAAGEYAKSEYRNENAVAYFSRALELSDDSDFDARYQYLVKRETIYQWLGSRQRQQQDLDQLDGLLATVQRADLQADQALRRSSFALVTGDYETAEDQVKEALAQARAAQDQQIEARVLHRWGRTLWQQGRSREAKSLLEDAIRRAETTNEKSILAACFVDLAGVLRQTGRYDEARHFLERATGAYEQLQDEQGIVRCLTLYGVIDTDLGFFAEAETAYQRALNIAHETGWRFAETTILVNMGATQFELGGFKKGAAYLNQALNLARETGDVRTQATSLDTLGLIAHYQGNPQEALASYDRARQILQTLDNQRELGYVMTHSGYAAIELGLFNRAKEDLLLALGARDSLGAAALKLDVLAGLARLSLVNGRLDEALQYTEDILSYIDENGTNGIELPVLVYLICYQVLAEAAGQDKSSRERAITVLDAGYELLQERLQRLPDDETRRRFLSNLHYNQDLRDFWLSHQT